MEFNRPSFHWADYVVFGVVLSVSAVIGIFYAFRGRRTRTTNEFMVASRQMGFFPVAMSLLASFFTGIYIQGTVSEVYYRGALAPFIAPVSAVIAAYMAGTIFLPTFYGLRVASVYQYLEMRFNKIVCYCCLIIGYLYMILHAGIATFAAGLVLTTVSDMTFLTAVVVLSGVCTFYTALGGIKAVVWADCFQMFLIFSPLVGAVVVALATIGLKNIWDISAARERLDIFNFSPDPTEYLTFWSAMVGGVFAWMPGQCILQYQVQRYNTCKDNKTAHITLCTYVCGCVLMTLLCALGGLSVYAVLADCDPFTAGIVNFRDELLPYFTLKSFSHLPGLPGLLVSGLCSAALSTVSSVINSVVTISGEHIVTKIWRNMSDSKYLLLTKLLVLFFGLLNIGITYILSILQDILPTLIGLIGITNGPVMGVFLLGTLIPKCNWKGAIVGFFTGFAFGLWMFIGSTIYQKPAAGLPVSVEGCSAELVTQAMNDSTIGYSTSEILQGMNSTAEPVDENVLALYLITRWWYPAITTCTVFVVGIVISFVTGFNDPSSMDRILFVDWGFVFCWCRKKRERQLEDNEPAVLVDMKDVMAETLRSGDGSISPECPPETHHVDSKSAAIETTKL